MPRYIDDLNECTDPTAGDKLLISDQSAASTDQDKWVDVNEFALTQSANTFTAANTFNVTTAFKGNLTIDKAAPSILMSGSGAGLISMGPLDNGTSYGNLLQVGRNTNTTGAPGVFRIQDNAGTWRAIWPDSGGMWRTGSILPNVASPNIGAYIGEQPTVSNEKLKEILGDASPIADVFERLSAASHHVRKFRYIPGGYGIQNELFEGLILREEAVETHYYGQNKSDPEYQAGMSLNVLNLCADLMRAVVHLHERVTTLEQQLAVPPSSEAPASI